jgi:hypothetical protein
VNRVIDWDTAQFVPMPAAINQPLFLADIPGWVNPIPDGMTFESDRKYLEDAVSKLTSKSGHSKARTISELLLYLSCGNYSNSLPNKKINERYIDLKIKGR